MRLHRIYSAAAITPDSDMDLTPDAARHVAQVLRLRANDQLILFDGSGTEYDCTLTGVVRSRASVNVGKSRSPNTESPIDITLWHGLCRGTRMDTVVQKATELGAKRIQPMVTSRSVVKLDAGRAAKRLEHWQKVAISAAEQSGRCVIPEVLHPVKFTELLSKFTGSGTKIIFDPGGTKLLIGLVQEEKSIVLCTGPEGGFTEDELQLAESVGFNKVAMGPRILRTETAPVVALSLTQHIAGDLRLAD